jgi:hypothetical protein
MMAEAKRTENPSRRRKQSPQKESIPTQEGVCFIMSPFGGWFDSYYQEIFSPAIEAAGLEPRRADSLFRSSNIVNDIWHLVNTSRAILADLTGKNPNVFYELGLAHAARKPALLITQTIDDVPFDLRALRVVTYDIQHPSWGDLLKNNIAEGLRETLASPEQAVLPTFLTEQPARGPSVSPDEKIVLELQQQINSLRAQVQSLSPRSSPPPARERTDTGVLIDAIVEALERGRPEEEILAILSKNRTPELAQEYLSVAKGRIASRASKDKVKDSIKVQESESSS